MFITATELKLNIDKYLIMAETNEIYITQNGKILAKLTTPYKDRVDVARALFGVMSDDVTLEESREERLSNI
ncbi:type II toxin-antitoxin system prevent-host-death family antitoxin [Clostridium bornimense]|uniref:type II toxin-antitoxin system prevent-host-death family antitoxin n=1 Tax=Clostridium bornimense TaxID=1216932 RepID=UPI001C105594|nr:type II toxin-antitoxin system prevent-host-death family antitoxin [Clostridium bornimense]MBU5317910.1 type II toxin-antitoxin system prevent-host-death family antitoxin [Clostridium bornimense]